jgi:2-polyprenyl-6-methoxyphenol hydroxylase-like FAD-dependent oxidoreductase
MYDTVLSMGEQNVVVVGASLAGCAAATLLAREGAHVTLIEKSPDPAHYKRICGHFIQASAVPSIERLGVLEQLREAGAVDSHSRLWMRWGWITSDDVPPSLNLRREKLDPIVRAHAVATPGVELRQGETVTGVVRDGKRIAGVELRGGEVLYADLVVGADGRDSTLAEVAEVPVKTFPHGRFSYGAYYQGPPPATAPDGQLWFLDPEWVAAFPTDDGLTMYAVMPLHERLPEFKADLAGALERMVSAVPEAPPILESERVSPVFGKVDMLNRMRKPAIDGLALVGDAALATDPIYGVGCGWAFQSAEWLADAVGGWARGEESLARGLRRYRRTWSRNLRPHAQMIHGYSGGRKFNAMERSMYKAAAGDQALANQMHRIGTRIASPMSVMRPKYLARIARGSRKGNADYSSTTSTSPSLTA